MEKKRTEQIRWARPAAGLAIIVGGLVIPLVGPLHLATAYVGALVTLLVVFALVMWSRLERLLTADQLPGITLAVAGDPQMFGLFETFGTAIRRMLSSGDPIYRELATGRFRRIVEEAQTVASGRIDFVGTEAWRSAYEQLLRSRNLHSYRSVAYLRTPNYWQDEPGRQSMRLNYEMVASGLIIQRIAIVPDAYWPQGEQDPVEPIGRWLHEQSAAGLRVFLVRESRLEGDQDLLADFGLYGGRAVGFQQIDDYGRTVHFTLSFDFAEHLAAENRWERLMVYAAEFGNRLHR